MACNFVIKLYNTTCESGSIVFPPHNTVCFKMKKAALFTFLLMFFTQLQAFSQQELDGRQLLERFKQVQSQIMNARIKLGEALIHYLEHAGDYVQAERMKSIYRLAADYQTFYDGEQRALFMYLYIKEGVKVYISAYLRDLLLKKKKELDASLQNLPDYSAEIKDKDTLLIITSLQSHIAAAQDLMNQLAEFYASENNKYKKDTSIAD